GPAEFGDNRHDSIAPLSAKLLRQGSESFAEAIDVAGKGTLSRALVDVRIPTADVDEPDAILLAHEPSDPPGLELEALGCDRVLVGLLHFLFHDVSYLLAQLQAILDLLLQVMARVHVGEN